MKNVTFIDVEQPNGDIETFAIIDRGEGNFTSMLKSVWEEQQKAAELGGTL